MATLHYIDNEVPAFGEWDSVVTVGASTIVQSAAAPFPERPSTGSGLGLRVTTDGANAAYVQKDSAFGALEPGGAVYVGCWFNTQQYPTASGVRFLTIGAGTDVRLYFYPYGAGAYTGLKLRVYDDAGSQWATRHLPEADRWHWVVVYVKRATTSIASDGEFALYMDGVKHAVTGVDNYDRLGAMTSVLRMGAPSAQTAIIDFDEIKIADSYPEPFVPTPLATASPDGTDEYPQARRTVVLFRQDSSDSRDFADYCVSELGVPRSNLCPLPNATATESLADYATFQTEVETDLATWLALNPTVAANCSCFLIGHGVPGYFTSGGVKHSATSRLMNYGTAFSSQTDNPLYNPATVARLTKTALGGKYLCTRIDADTLQHSKDIIDRSLVVAALSAIPAAEKLYSDDSTYKASLACQHLRIITAALGEFADDAFVWGDTGTPSFGAAGSQAVFADDSADSADTFRTGGGPCRGALNATYAAALGFSAGSDSLDPGPFFEMLRLGGTLAEAFIVAVAKLDYTAVGVGSPLMTVAFGLGGYNIYRGLGGIEGIDWEKPVAYLRADQDSITFDQDLSPGRSYVYAVRAVSSAGVEERNTHIITYVEPDEQGDLLPAPLARPTDLTADVQPSNLLIGFSYYAPVGFAGADGFGVLSDNGTGQLDLDNPIATVERTRNDRFDFEVSIARPDTPVLLAVRARQGQRTGSISEILFVPLISAPAPVKTL